MVFKRLPKINFNHEAILAFVLLWSTISSLIYRVYRFDWFNIIGSLVSSIVLALILRHFSLFFNEAKGASQCGSTKTGGYGRIWMLISGLLISLELFFLWHNRSTESIVTPWQALPVLFFVVYFFAVASLLISLKRSSLGLWFFALASLAVIPIIYRLGYGYDFFIHEASLREIMTKGAIFPKTNYYFGQYVFILLLQKLLHIPYSILHLWLVPLVSACLLPWLIMKNFRLPTERIGWLLTLGFPFAFLTFTTPQNFGLVLLLAEIILLSKPSKNNLLLSGFLVLFNLTIHPISAIPGLTLLALIGLEQRQIKNRLAFFFGASLPLLIPLLLLLTGAAHWTGFRPFDSLFAVSPFALPNNENIFLNLAYGYYANIEVIAVLLFAAATLVYYRQLKDLMANIGLSLGLIGTVIIMQFIELRNVIDYEQADYAKRLLLIAFLVVLPIVVKLLIASVRKVILLGIKEQLIWLVFAAGLLTMSFYLSYPRHDNYFNSRGLSIGQGDIEAVRYIDADAHGQSYIVLANQQVSAASLREFGFAHYYKNNFYYPIPTTNPFYNYYLDMVYREPSRDTALAAKALAGTDSVYFVLNKYWQDFPKLLEEAKLSAKSYKSFADNSVYVFSY